MDLVTIGSFSVPSTALITLASASTTSGGNLAQVIPVLQYLQGAEPYLPWSDQLFLTVLQGWQSMTDPEDWASILAGFVGAACASSEGQSALQLLTQKQLSSAVLMFIANNTDVTLSLDPSSDKDLYCAKGDPLLAPASIPAGSVGAFLFGSSGLLDATQGALMLNTPNGIPFLIGWYDPHSGDNGCGVGLTNPPADTWYEYENANNRAWNSTAAVPQDPSPTLTAAVSATSGALVTIAANVAGA